MRSDRILWWCVGGLVLFRAILVGWWPFPVQLYTPGEAGFILQQAMFLLDGEWLGPYDNNTLAKSPVAPMWIAAMHFAGIPLLLAQHALYICVCVICMVAGGRITHNRGVQIFVFTILLFNPFSYGYESVATSFRELLEQSLLLGVLGTSTIIFLDLSERGKVQATYCVLFGVFFTLFWNNGGARLSVLAYLLWILLVCVHYFKGRDKLRVRSMVSGVLQTVLIPAALLVLVTGAIAFKNLDEYGVFAISEASTPEFETALRGIVAIDSGRWRPNAALPADMIEKIRSLSSGAELIASIENVSENPLVFKGTLAGLLRAVVQDAGYYEAGGAAVLAYYRRLGQEIDNACNDKTFECREPLFGLLPPWREGLAASWADAFREVVVKAVQIPALGTVEDIFSSGDPVALLGASRLVNSPVRADESLEYFLPEFYKQAKKDKTRVHRKLVEFYRAVIPVVFWAALLGLVWRIYLVVSNHSWSRLDKVFFGLAGSLLAQITLIACTRVAGNLDTMHLYYAIYPVLYLFIALGLLSLWRSVSGMKLLINYFPRGGAH